MESNRELLESILTVADRDSALSELEVAGTEVFYQQPSVEERLKTLLSTSVYGLILNAGQTAKVDLADKKDMDRLLRQLRADLLALPVVGLTLAFLPSRETVKFLADRARQLFGENVILELSLDRSLIGGALVTFGGFYLDYSLRTRLTEVFANQEEKVREVLELGRGG